MATATQKRLEVLEARAAIQYPDLLKQFEGMTAAQVQQNLTAYDQVAGRLLESADESDPVTTALRAWRAGVRRLGVIKD